MNAKLGSHRQPPLTSAIALLACRTSIRLKQAQQPPLHAPLSHVQAVALPKRPRASSPLLPGACTSSPHGVQSRQSARSPLNCSYQKCALPLGIVILFLALATTFAGPSADSLVGTWKGSGKTTFQADYQIKLVLKSDKTCVLEYSDREPPHTLNPYLKVERIVVTGPWTLEVGQWTLEVGQAGSRILVDAKISEWTETISPQGEKPSTSKIEPKPFADEFYFAIEPDGTLTRVLLIFKGKDLLLPGIPMQTQALGVNLTKENAKLQ